MVNTRPAWCTRAMSWWQRAARGWSKVSLGLDATMSGAPLQAASLTAKGLFSK